MSLGPTCIVVKRGEYGVFMMSREEIFLAPAYPLEDVFDPTGAGRTPLQAVSWGIFQILVIRL